MAKLVEVEQLRAAVEQLAQKVHDCDQTVKHDRPAAPTPRAEPLPSDAGGCDEVSCVLTDYEGACCEKFRGPQPPARQVTRPSGPPETLDRQMISAAMASVRGDVAACGQHATARGVVKVHVRVDAAGRVSNVDIDQTPDAALGACVRSALQPARFDATARGGSFSYPFVF